MDFTQHRRIDRVGRDITDMPGLHDASDDVRFTVQVNAHVWERLVELCPNAPVLLGSVWLSIASAMHEAMPESNRARHDAYVDTLVNQIIRLLEGK